MPLILDLPSTWLTEELPGGVRAARPGVGAGEPVLSWGPIVEAPDDPDRWIGRELAHANVLRSAALKTALGWDVRLVEAEVPVDGSATELHVVAFYRFFGLAAMARVRIGSRARYDAVSEKLLEILLGGRPELRSESIHCLEQLFDLDEPMRAPAPPAPPATPGS